LGKGLLLGKGLAQVTLISTRTADGAGLAAVVSLMCAFSAAAQTTPAPPTRPAGITAPASTPAAAKPATPDQSAPRSGAKVMTEAEALAKVNAYLNSFRTLQGNFIQFGADGKRHEGMLHLSRPGKLRFEYKPPATIDVVADGTSVAVRDRKLATQDLYTIAQTPLKFLVRDKIDLGSDLKVIRVQSTPELVRVALEDRSTLGGTSKITLTYDPVANTLRQWVVVDPQGYETTIAVYNLETQKRPDPALFVIDYQRQLDTNRN
jgi:outer membrane lipoprotein-sorting protein